MTNIKALEKKLNAALDMLARVESMVVNASPEEIGRSLNGARSREMNSGAPRLAIDNLTLQERDGQQVVEAARGTALYADRQGNYKGGLVLCSDGQVRKITWLGKVTREAPVSAAVKVGNATVSGYLVLEPAHVPADAPAIKFLVNETTKHSAALPAGTFKGRRTEDRWEDGDILPRMAGDVLARGGEQSA